MTATQPHAPFILVVDDDALMRRSVTASLEQAGFVAQSAPNAEDALLLLQTKRPNLVLLDIGLPGMDGLDALRQIRTQSPTTPVIFVTARRRELDEVVGLELGADDYITKPFDMDVLLAHIRAVLRRAAAQPAVIPHPDRYTVGALEIDVPAHVVTVRGRPVDLAPKEYDLLLVLARNAGRVVSLDDLLEQVWGPEWIGETQTLYVHVRWLREKIEDDPAKPQRLLTVRGAGYKLAAAP